MPAPAPFALGLDFGTTNSVAAVSRGDAAELVLFDGPEAQDAVFRSALCFWEEEGHPGGLASDAGPGPIKEYLACPQDGRFLQSFKPVPASASFKHPPFFDRRYSFEDI